MLDKLKSAAKRAGGWTPDALMLLGAAAISYGAGLMYLPAGFVVGGLLAIGAGYLSAKAS